MNEIEPLKNHFDSLEEKINSPVVMHDANEEIEIFKGDFMLIYSGGKMTISGTIVFQWFPQIGVKFSGRSKSALDMSLAITNEIDIEVNGQHFARGWIKLQRIYQDVYLEGTCSKPILGDKTIAVNKVRFAIPNLREYFGEVIKESTNGHIRSECSRIVFENEEYRVVLDKLGNYKEFHEVIEAKGGFIVLFSGEITKIKGPILLAEMKDFLMCFDHFLYFLNGRRCAMMFLTGEFENEVVWTDYTGYVVDAFKFVPSWTKAFLQDTNEIFKNFTKLWKDKKDRSFLESVIHWYVSANGQDGYVEGAIIFTQTALELIYNWLLVEKKKIILGKDAENISAANKIRLLLTQLNIELTIPPNLDELLKLEDVADGPELFVSIRNALVHGQEKKRKDLMSMNMMVKYQSLQLGLWYVELSMLYILGFNHHYHNRTGVQSSYDIGEMVPWKAKNSLMTHLRNTDI